MGGAKLAKPSLKGALTGGLGGKDGLINNANPTTLITGGALQRKQTEDKTNTQNPTVGTLISGLDKKSTDYGM